MDDQQRLIEEAKIILEQNWQDGFTIPRAELYPFQWNWDSGFVALGWSHFKVENALRELNSLFSGQWLNGMIPHIVFHSENETTYFPNHDFWKTDQCQSAPDSPKTSGISQPPVHAFILERIYVKHQDNPEILDAIQELFPKILRAHRWWYQHRDPLNEGLVYIYHPWESGRDNSPMWDEALGNIVFDRDQLPTYERKDTAHTEADMRPTKRDYDVYVYLLEVGKKYQYEGPEIFHVSPYVIQDTLINAILIKSNESLIRIGKLLGYSMSDLEKWNRKSKVSFEEKLWNEELGVYTCYNLRTNRQIACREIGAFTALFAGIPSIDRAQKLMTLLHSWQEKGFSLCPSFDPGHGSFDSKRYWRGPIWPQMNWLINQGLLRYGFDDLATAVKQDLIRLVKQMGFYEYFEANLITQKGLDRGYGGSHFSWTASTIIDLMKSEK